MRRGVGGEEGGQAALRVGVGRVAHHGDVAPVAGGRLEDLALWLSLLRLRARCLRWPAAAVDLVVPAVCLQRLQRLGEQEPWPESEKQPWTHMW